MCEIERKRGDVVERGKEITKNKQKKERDRGRNSVEEGKSEIEERKSYRERKTNQLPWTDL